MRIKFLDAASAVFIYELRTPSRYSLLSYLFVEYKETDEQLLTISST